MVIGHCITYMGIKIEQNDDLGKKSYTQFLIKNESILVEETFIDHFFSELNFLLSLPLTSNFPRPRFCLFLKFTQAIVIRVLMQNL